MTAAAASLATGLRQRRLLGYLGLLPLLDEDCRRLRLRLSAVVIACLLVAAIIHPGITT